MCGCVPKISGISTSCVRVSKYIQKTHTHTHTYQYTHTRTRKVCSGVTVDLCALTVTFSHSLSLTHIHISYMYLYTQHKCAVVTIWYKTTSEGQHLLKQAGLEGKKIHCDHIFPVSKTGTGFGVHHVANLYILTQQENQYFGDSTERWRFKIENLGSVSCFSFYL